MASNSLLECLVYAQAAAGAINQLIQQIPEPDFIPSWDESRVSSSDENVVISHNWDELRRFMWDYVGIVRTDKRLQRAQHRIKLLQGEIQEYYSNCKVGRDLLELRNLATVSELVIRCAMQRKESRGLHYTLDYPDLSPIARRYSSGADQFCRSGCDYPSRSGVGAGSNNSWRSCLCCSEQRLSRGMTLVRRRPRASLR